MFDRVGCGNFHQGRATALVRKQPHDALMSAQTVVLAVVKHLFLDRVNVNLILSQPECPDMVIQCARLTVLGRLVCLAPGHCE